MENSVFQNLLQKKLDLQVDHSLRSGLGSQGLRVALEVLGVLVLQAHPAERP